MSLEGVSMKSTSCPYCGATETIRSDGFEKYVCGYYKRFLSSGVVTGECTKRMKLPKIARPRVRVLFDKVGVPTWVQVNIAPTCDTSQVFDEFDGMLQVTTDKQGKLVQSIRLNCTRLSGRDVFDNLLDLLVTIRNRSFRSIPVLKMGRLAKAIKACEEAIGEDRIEAKVKLIKDAKAANWGQLHPLLEKCIESPYPNSKDLAQMFKNIKDDDKRHAYLDEMMRECIEEYGSDAHSLPGYVANTISGVLLSLSPLDGTFKKYYEHFVGSGNLKHLYWIQFFNNMHQNSVADQYEFCVLGLTLLKDWKVTDDNEQELARNKNYLLQHFEPLLDMVQPELFGKAKEFLKEYIEDETQPGPLSYAEEILVQLDFNEDDFEDGPQEENLN